MSVVADHDTVHCRRRKIRCQAGADVRQKCTNCERLGKDCNFENEGEGPSPDTFVSGRALSSKNSFGSPSPGSMYGSRLGHDYDNLSSIPPTHPGAYLYDHRDNGIPIYDRHGLSGVPNGLPQLSSHVHAQQHPPIGHWPVPSTSPYGISQAPASGPRYLSASPQYGMDHGHTDRYGDSHPSAYSYPPKHADQPMYVSPQQVPSQPLPVAHPILPPLSTSKSSQHSSYVDTQLPWHEYGPSNMYEGIYRHDSGNSSWAPGSDSGADSRGYEGNSESKHAKSSPSRPRAVKCESPG